MAAPADPGPALSEGQIVEAARQLIVEKGVGGLTMRALSAELGVALGATYHHVANKRELLLLVARNLYDEVVLPPRGSWDQRLKKLIVNIATVVGSYPGMAQFMNANTTDAMPVELNREVTSLLREAGFSSRNVHALMGALFIYVNGVSSGNLDAPLSTADVGRLFNEGLDMLLTGAKARLDQDLKARRG